MLTRTRLILAGALVMALCGSFAAGRYTRTVQTRDVVRTETQWKDREVVKVVHDVQTVHDVATQTRTVTVTKWAKAPDGSPVVTQETHAERDQQAETKRQDHTQGTQERRSEAHQATVETHTTESRPNWSVSVFAGVQDGGKRLVAALPGPLVVGVSAEHRLIGPLSAGIWGTTGRAAGISVRLDF